jgi:hypothetical protein
MEEATVPETHCHSLKQLLIQDHHLDHLLDLEGPFSAHDLEQATQWTFVVVFVGKLCKQQSHHPSPLHVFPGDTDA